MERLCFTFEIRPGTEDEYKRRHDEIWPELVEAIKDSGFENYSLFRSGTTIVAYVECYPGRRDRVRQARAARGQRAVVGVVRGRDRVAYRREWGALPTAGGLASRLSGPG